MLQRRFHSEDGANALEFALVLPILVLLLFGAITFGLAFNAKQQLEHANREGVRFAATLADPGTDTWFDAVFERIVLTGSGQAQVTDDSLDVCVSYDDGTTVVSRNRTGNAAYASSADLSGDTNDGTGADCVSSAPTDSTVQITIDRDARLDAVFFVHTVTLTTDGVARYEETDS